MKKTSQFHTLRIFVAILWLALTPTASRLVAQSFYTVEEALEEAEYRADEIQTLAASGLRTIPQLREALEDGDFRAQRPLFRKMHVLLNDIENETVALTNAANEACKMDARLDLSGIRESAVYIGANEDYAALSLLDVAQALHEGTLDEAESALREAEIALLAIRTFAQTAEDDSRMAIRSF